jgi:rRNA biogenesis protein RRP5
MQKYLRLVCRFKPDFFSQLPVLKEDNAKKSRKKKTKSAVNSATSAKPSEGKDRIRIEHLNYKVSWRVHCAYSPDTLG